MPTQYTPRRKAPPRTARDLLKESMELQLGGHKEPQDTQGSKLQQGRVHRPKDQALKINREHLYVTPQDTVEVFLEPMEYPRPDSTLEIQVEPMEEFILGSILELITEATGELSLGLMLEQRVRRGTELLPRWAHPRRRRLHGEQRALVHLRRRGPHLRVQCPR